jgi:hypothetical protein
LVLPHALLVGGVLRFAGAGIVGTLAAGGPHHLTMWRLFGNPFFPMFNDLFHSPYWEAAGPRDTRFLPKTWFDWLFYPFEWAQNSGHGIVSELAFRDIRVAVAISLGILAALTWLPSRPMRRPERAPVSPGLRAFMIFMLVAYLLWLPRHLLPAASSSLWVPILSRTSSRSLIGRCNG